MNRTTKRTIEMLELISSTKDGMYLKDIVEKMEIPKSSAFDILHTLLESKMVNVKDGNEKKYVIGIKAFEIGSSFMKDIDLINKAKNELELLAETVNKTAFIGVMDGKKIVYIFKYQPRHARLTASSIGSRNDLHNTSLGKAILAYMDDEKRDQIVGQIEFKKKTNRTITDKTSLLEDLKKVKERGFSTDNRELEEHMFCMGAPIFDYTGKVIASISISDLYDEGMNVEEQGRMVKETAKKISQNLGYMQ
jgi:DNA-binding IclR family transcriptional regulator